MPALSRASRDARTPRASLSTFLRQVLLWQPTHKLYWESSQQCNLSSSLMCHLSTFTFPFWSQCKRITGPCRNYVSFVSGVRKGNQPVELLKYVKNDIRNGNRTNQSFYLKSCWNMRRIRASTSRTAWTSETRDARFDNLRIWASTSRTAETSQQMVFELPIIHQKQKHTRCKVDRSRQAPPRLRIDPNRTAFRAISA